MKESVQLPLDKALLEERIGYKFNNPELLSEALTHSSYVNEYKSKGGDIECNERLEFLGDSVLSIIVSFYRFCRSVPGNDGHITTPCIQRPHDIHFHSAVDGHDMKSAALALGMTDAAAADAGYRVFGNNGVGKYLQANV